MGASPGWSSSEAFSICAGGGLLGDDISKSLALPKPLIVARMVAERSSVRRPALSTAQVKPFRSVARSSIFAAPLAQHVLIFLRTSKARAFSSLPSQAARVEKAHAVFESPLASNSVSRRSTVWDMLDTNSSFGMCILAKAHRVLARSLHVHSPTFSMAFSDKADISSGSSIRSVAKAHAVFDRFCVSNSLTFASASSEIACMSSSNFCSIFAKAHDVFARPWGPNSLIFWTDCSMKASIFSVMVKFSVAIDHTVFAKFCALNSSMRPMVVPHSESINCSFLFMSLAHDQMMLAK
mmetsp:Transcript_76904/g.229205  ORF Transcript_76904/g.229205 Transcript_76904/m.229205 type:complete len:295 (-) Transcript_76904:58-942(-)